MSKKNETPAIKKGQVKRFVIKRRFSLRCVVTGVVSKIIASSYDEACDVFVDDGWSYDRFFGGYVCRDARVV